MDASVPDLAKAEAAIIELTNRFRAENRVPAVRADPALRRVAQSYADYLARSGLFAHSADGRQPGDRARAGGYAPCQVAENLALNLDSRGFRTEDLARQAVEGWKSSPGHRRNMLAPLVTDVGVGIARAPGEPKYISVQLFGRPQSMAMRFRIENRTGQAVRYRFLAQAHDIPARHVVTHTSCQPGPLRFEGALGGAAGRGEFAASDGTVYRLTADQDGSVRVEITR